LYVVKDMKLIQHTVQLSNNHREVANVVLWSNRFNE